MIEPMPLSVGNVEDWRGSDFIAPWVSVSGFGVEQTDLNNTL